MTEEQVEAAASGEASGEGTGVMPVPPILKSVMEAIAYHRADVELLVSGLKV